MSQETLNKLENLKKQYTQEAQNAFKEFTKALFDNHPEVEFLYWNQYTPYFNDGDPCVFNVREFALNGYEYWKNYNPHYMFEDESDDEGNLKYTRPKPEAFETARQIFKLPDEIFLEVFGDHCSVTLYRDGTQKVEDFDHD